MPLKRYQTPTLLGGILAGVAAGGAAADERERRGEVERQRRRQSFYDRLAGRQERRLERRDEFEQARESRLDATAEDQRRFENERALRLDEEARTASLRRERTERGLLRRQLSQEDAAREAAGSQAIEGIFSQLPIRTPASLMPMLAEAQRTASRLEGAEREQYLSASRAAAQQLAFRDARQELLDQIDLNYRSDLNAGEEGGSSAALFPDEQAFQQYRGLAENAQSIDQLQQAEALYRQYVVDRNTQIETDSSIQSWARRLGGAAELGILPEDSVTRWQGLLRMAPPKNPTDVEKLMDTFRADILTPRSSGLMSMSEASETAAKLVTVGGKLEAPEFIRWFTTGKPPFDALPPGAQSRISEQILSIYESGASDEQIAIQLSGLGVDMETLPEELDDKIADIEAKRDAAIEAERNAAIEAAAARVSKGKEESDARAKDRERRKKERDARSREATSVVEPGLRAAGYLGDGREEEDRNASLSRALGYLGGGG